MIKKSLHTKLLIGMLIAMLVPFLISNFVSYQSSSQVIEEHQLKTNRVLIESGMDNISYYLKELDKMSLSWIYDEKLMNTLRSENLNMNQVFHLDYEMKNLLYYDPDIMGVQFFVKKTGQTYSSHKKSSFNPKIYPVDYERLDDVFRYFEIKEIYGKPTIIVHRKIVDMPENKVLGYLSIFVSASELNEILTRLHKKDEEVILLFGANNPSYYSPTMKLSKKNQGFLDSVYKEKRRGDMTYEFNDEEGTIIFENDELQDISFTLVKFIPFSMISKEASAPLQKITLVQIIAVVLLAIFIYIISFSIISPIKRLIKNIESIEKGKFNIEEDNVRNRYDELGVLESRFSDMVHRLNQLINKEYRLQMEIKTAQIKVLQAQINPHFLYNTLQSIGTIALKNGVYEVYERVGSLSSLFRYSMNFDPSSVPLKEEVTQIEEYLYLQKGRFKEKLQYEIDCTEESLNTEVPKMILQPLIENSIIHGVEKGTQAGYIKMSSYIENDFLILQVTDFGSGFTTGKIEEIRKKFNEKEQIDSTDNGIGLLNVLFRLHFEYGDLFQWFIESQAHEETTISLKLPRERAEDQ